MTRAEAIRTIEKIATLNLLEELRERVDVSDDETFDLCDALEWFSDLAETCCEKKELLRVEVALGLVAPISRDNMRLAMLTGLGVRRSDYRTLDGVLYESVISWYEWADTLNKS